MKTKLAKIFGFGILTVLAGVAQANWSSGITYEGQIIKPDGRPMEGSVVQFRLQIRTPNSSNCLMYEEIQSRDMRNSSGVFTLTINDGTGVRIDSNPWSLDRIFASRGSFNFDASACQSGNTYTPNVGDGRRFQASFKDESMSSWESLPAMMISFVPMAIEANQVAGFPGSSLLRVEDSIGPVAVTSLSPFEYTELVALILGASTQYSRRNQLNGANLPTSFSAGQSIRWNGSTWEAYSPSSAEVDPTVMAFAKTALPNCAAGSVLTSDGSTFSCVPDQITSDRRLKERIQPLENTLERLLKLETVSFHWSDKQRDQREGRRLGLIAQNVERVFPEAVRLHKGNGALSGGTKMVAYHELLSPVIQSIRELHGTQSSHSLALEKHNLELKAELESMKARQADLQKAFCEIHPALKPCVQ
jgi:hypothetical protein